MGDQDDGKERKKILAMVVGVVAGVIIILALAAAVYTFTQRRNSGQTSIPEYSETMIYRSL